MKLGSWLVFILLIAVCSGCVRLVGKAGYVKETPEERTSKTVGFDTDELFAGQKTKGSITAA